MARENGTAHWKEGSGGGERLFRGEWGKEQTISPNRAERRDSMSAPWYDNLGFLNLLDWLEGLGRGIIYGDVTPIRLTLPHPESDWWDENPDVQFWNLTAVQDLLKSYHVKTFWHGFNADQIWTHVPNKQARWAEYLLHRAGAIPPLTMQTVDGRNVSWASNPKHGGKLPTRWADRPDTGRRGRGRGKRERRNEWAMF